jgi:hypothetical protein
MNDALSEQVKLFVLQLLQPGLVTRAQIETELARVITLFQDRDPSAQFDTEQLIRDLEAALYVFQPETVSVEDDRGHEEWLLARKDSVEWRFWDRFLRYAREQERLPPAVLDRLDTSTWGILRKLENPQRRAPWDRRGMVVGQIQSGKTGNYIGLICRAADAGYRLIVILAGSYNNLRSQTQLRVDAGFLGIDTQRRMLADTDAAFAAAALGVGRLLGAPRLDAASLTTSADNGDFGVRRASSAGIMIGGYPVILVVKKHRGILDNLRDWVSLTHGTGEPRLVRDIPLLVIDDEADNASINTRDQRDRTGEYDPDIDPTAVNGAIRQLLNVFEKKAYVGYTATPYANIFIPDAWAQPEYGPDLFPESFIEYLRPPSSYFGPSRLFGIPGVEDPLPLFRPVDDQQNWIPDRHRADHRLGSLPESVRTAMKAFVLARAARLARGQVGVHNSMLIHVTRYRAVQQQIRDQIGEELNDLRGRIRFGDGAGPSIRNELKALWKRDFVPTTQASDIADTVELEWREVDAQLEEAVKPIEVKLINGDAQDALDYFEHRDGGFNVIAVGGDKLSRGLTLEGLTVSYYLRASRAYDTLLQMGRWFGYRPGYEDLCRLWTTRPLWRAYNEITQANEELIAEFEEMSARGLTPKDYGLKVRGSANGMLVTAPSKMRAGTRLRVGFSGAIAETVVLYCDKTPSEANLDTVETFIQLLRNEYGEPTRKTGNYLWQSVSGTLVADEFFADFSTPTGAWRVHAPTIAEYIRNRVAANELVDWTVVLVSAQDKKEQSEIGGLNLGLTKRSVVVDQKDRVPEGLYSIRRILNPPDEWIDLSSQQIEGARLETQARWRSNPGRRRNFPADPSGPVLREYRPRERGLLLIYPLEPPEPSLAQGSRTVTDKPLMGFAVSFPKSPDAPMVDYVVNRRFVEELSGETDE